MRTRRELLAAHYGVGGKPSPVGNLTRLEMRFISVVVLVISLTILISTLLSRAPAPGTLTRVAPDLQTHLDMPRRAKDWPKLTPSPLPHVKVPEPQSGHSPHKLLLATHGRLLWLNVESGSTSVLHEGRGVYYGVFSGEQGSRSVWVVSRPHNWRPTTSKEYLLNIHLDRCLYCHCTASPAQLSSCSSSSSRCAMSHAR